MPPHKWSSDTGSVQTCANVNLELGSTSKQVKVGYVRHPTSNQTAQETKETVPQSKLDSQTSQINAFWVSERLYISKIKQRDQCWRDGSQLRALLDKSHTGTSTTPLYELVYFIQTTGLIYLYGRCHNVLYNEFQYSHILRLYCAQRTKLIITREIFIKLCCA